MQRALFLDRDGVLNVDHGYVGKPDEFELIPSVIDVLRLARDQHYLLIVVTNQSGLARGYFTPDDYLALEKHMRQRFAEHGVCFAGIYHCPHYPEGVVPELAIECACRKPAPGLILRAAREHDVDLCNSILVGDKSSDMVAAAAAGVGRAVLVKGAGKRTDSFKEILDLLKGR